MRSCSSIAILILLTALGCEAERIEPDGGAPADTEGSRVGDIEVLEKWPTEPRRVGTVPYREEWPQGAHAAVVTPFAPERVHGAWIDGLDSLRGVIESETEWRGFWRAQNPRQPPADFSTDVLLMAGYVGSGPPPIVDSGVVWQDTLFVVLGPRRPCPPPGEVVIGTGMIEKSVSLGRTPQFAGTVVFVDPKRCSSF